MAVSWKLVGVFLVLCLLVVPEPCFGSSRVPLKLQSPKGGTCFLDRDCQKGLICAGPPGTAKKCQQIVQTGTVGCQRWGCFTELTSPFAIDHEFDNLRPTKAFLRGS